MAAVHGRNTYISAATVNLSTYTDSSEFSVDVDTDETSAYGQEDKTYIAGLVDRTFTMSGKYDDGASSPRTVFEAAIAGDVPIAFVRRVAGTGTGKPEQQFNGIVTSYVETNPVGGKVAWSADIQVSGPVTPSTQA